MGIFDLFKRDYDWDTIKKSGKVYPENSISVIAARSESGKPLTGWVNMAYVNYRYKKYCPFNLQFTIEINENKNHLHPSAIEDYFVNELKTGCITHPVAMISADPGMIINVYVDDPDFASILLSEMYEDPGKPVEFGCEFHFDPRWKEYTRITEMTAS